MSPKNKATQPIKIIVISGYHAPLWIHRKTHYTWVFLSEIDLKKFWVHAYVCLRYLPMKANSLLAKSRAMKTVVLY